MPKTPVNAKRNPVAINQATPMRTAAERRFGRNANTFSSRAFDGALTSLQPNTEKNATRAKSISTQKTIFPAMTSMGASLPSSAPVAQAANLLSTEVRSNRTLARRTSALGKIANDSSLLVRGLGSKDSDLSTVPIQASGHSPLDLGELARRVGWKHQTPQAEEDLQLRREGNFDGHVSQ